MPDGSDARVVLKRVKRRVEVHSASLADAKNRLGVAILPVLPALNYCVLLIAQSPTEVKWVNACRCILKQGRRQLAAPNSKRCT